MDQTRYWMWERSRSYCNRPPIGINPTRAAVAASSFDSWEEAAFAKEYAGGDLWGCVWPPRSYTCSFCFREFRSAQALGGHMNVHRRDRARLKQEASSPSNSEENPNPSSQPATSFSFQTQRICGENIRANSPFAETPPAAARVKVSVDLKLGGRDCKRRREDCGDDEISSCKRMNKNYDDLALSLSGRTAVKNDDYRRRLLKSEILKARTWQVEELDLELRLGDAPKVQQSCSIIVIE